MCSHLPAKDRCRLHPGIACAWLATSLNWKSVTAAQGCGKRAQMGKSKRGTCAWLWDGSAVHALDCDEAASLGASNFFQVAVPAYDPKAVVAVRSLGELLRGSLARQGKLLKELQALLPKLATCKAKISLASLPNRASGLQAAAGIISLASRNALSSHADKESLAGKVGALWGEPA